MIVHTHVESTLAFNYDDLWKLVALWKHSWEMNGFICIVTTQELFNNPDPIVQQYLTKIKSFPSVNPRGFDSAAFARWLAAYLVARNLDQPIITTEVDLINYTFCPEHTTLSIDKLHIARPEGCPVFSYSSYINYKFMVQSIIDYTVQDNDSVDGRPHLSDQDFICKRLRHTDVFSELRLDISNVFDPNWQSSSLVHYGNPFLIRNNQPRLPKYKTIQSLRSVPRCPIDV